MTKIIDGKKISKEIKDEIKQQVAEMKKTGKNIDTPSKKCYSFFVLKAKKTRAEQTERRSWDVSALFFEKIVKPLD